MNNGADKKVTNLWGKRLNCVQFWVSKFLFQKMIKPVTHNGNNFWREKIFGTFSFPFSYIQNIQKVWVANCFKTNFCVCGLFYLNIFLLVKSNIGVLLLNFESLFKGKILSFIRPNIEFIFGRKILPLKQHF